MPLAPWFRSPLTDLTGAIISHQWYGRCADMEMTLIDCLEAYGLERGVQKCQDALYDFKECSNRTVQMKRAVAMRDERERQYKAGERTKDNRYATPPKLDSY